MSGAVRQVCVHLFIGSEVQAALYKYSSVCTYFYSCFSLLYHPFLLTSETAGGLSLCIMNTLAALNSTCSSDSTLDAESSPIAGLVINILIFKKT